LLLDHAVRIESRWLHDSLNKLSQPFTELLSHLCRKQRFKSLEINSTCSRAIKFQLNTSWPKPIATSSSIKSCVVVANKREEMRTLDKRRRPKMRSQKAGIGVAISSNSARTTNFWPKIRGFHPRKHNPYSTLCTSLSFFCDHTRPKV